MYAVETTALSVDLGIHRALENVDLQVEAGSFVVITGPNGAGKSTLLRAILGLVPVSGGDVRVFDKPPAQVARESVAYVPQIKTLDRSFPALSCELVASGFCHRWPWRVSRRAHGAAVEALELVGGAHLAHRPLSELSGGELQRVYLARALVRDPALILLDEPATGIDMAGESDMYRILDDYHHRSDVTILMVTHDALAAHHHASHALLLNRRVISYGPAREALAPEYLGQAFGHGAHTHRGCACGEEHDV
ncbi:metal ABC transporter ATP-binding protein [bacterium]|nr:metal ABC transporter ATP-binding protein [bacterium]